MTRTLSLCLLAFPLAALLLAGCSDSDVPAGSLSDTPARSAADPYRLAEEPPGARGVLEIRKECQNGDEVTVVGRIAGSEEPLVKGRAAFTIVDLSLEPCECEEPWVYCCTPKEELLPATVLVKFVDEAGKTVPQDARPLLGVKEWLTVVVRGKAQCDPEGKLTSIAARGLFIRR
jgi:hypothetical protein